MSGSANAAGIVIPMQEMKTFMTNCMVKVGTEESHAEALADVLLAADYRGHYSHGLNRLAMYVDDIKKGICEAKGNPIVLKESVSTALVDGKNLLGPVIGNFCMDLAIKKAKETGIGWVAAKGSNHFGIVGWYTIRASNQGLVGMAFTNASPLVAPTRGIMPVIGTNPLSVAAPSKNDDSFVLDMANSAVALGKVEIQNVKGEKIPEGWGINAEGKITTEPKEVIYGGALLPLGGVEKTGGYKGYGLAVMAEIFCGIFSGSLYGPHIRKWMETDRKADLGQCFVAINPDAFAPGFEERMSDLMNILRNETPAEDGVPVLVAGDPERAHMAKCDSQGGISYHKNQVAGLIQLAKELQVPVPNAAIL